MKSFLEKTLSLALLGSIAIILSLALAAAPVQAAITLIDANSEVQIDPASQAGLYSWKVDGTNYDAKQWFWYRLGPNGGEQSLDTLQLVGTPTLSDTTGEGDIDTVDMLFTNDPTNHGLNIKLKFSLLGSDFGTSDILEQIRIENKTGSTMDMHFFQYNNFILSNGQDTVTFSDEDHNRVLQTGPVYQLGELIGENSGEGVVSGFPTHEGALVPTTLSSLNDALPTALNNGMDAVGPGNVSWAFQWDVTINPGGYLLISKTKQLNVVPEPAAIALLCLGVLSAGLLQWRKRVR